MSHHERFAKIVDCRVALGIAFACALVSGCTTGGAHRQIEPRRPNVLLIMTDDQGYGDLGCTGNPHVRTPNIDQLCRDSVVFNHFHVSAVCSPTRASLMTGRYNYRTGVVDTYLGRSMMHSDEVTLAEILSARGYRTGIFGKWHLGDSYPLRAMDQGFSEALVHKGGGLVQPSDVPDGSYFNPVLYHNGKVVRPEGYCTDIFTDAAIRFIEASGDRPFFVYLPTNAPHGPLEVADELVAPYLAMGLEDETARFYAMVSNIDDNVGRLLGKLKELQLDDNTLVIFLTDNGPTWSQGQERYNAGMRGTKGTVYDGGIRVPCFVRWPAMLKAGTQVEAIAAHIDILPTVLEICSIPVPAGLELDGKSLMPLMTGRTGDWSDRTLFFQWHRGDAPERFRSAAVRSPRYKLVNGRELYDMMADPGEQHNVADRHDDIVARLRADYEAWFADVGSTRGYAPPRIVVGTSHENPATLSRQDWRSGSGWEDGGLGHWELRVATEGVYRITVRFPTTPKAKSAHLRVADVSRDADFAAGQVACVFEDVHLRPGNVQLEASLMVDGKRVGPRFVDVERIE